MTAEHQELPFISIHFAIVLAVWTVNDGHAPSADLYYLLSYKAQDRRSSDKLGKP